ncbi:hypothetical protein ACJQWK_10256 [Exserohilum turcicum]
MERLGPTIALPAKALDMKEPAVKVAALAPTPLVSSNSRALRSAYLLHPDRITGDFDAHRFEAAAHGQLVCRDISTCSANPALSPTTPDSRSEVADEGRSRSDLLISSPYNKPNHYLDLTSPSLPLQSVLLALALTALQPVVPTYATAPYTAALNLDAVLDVLRALARSEGVQWQEAKFYVVVFRSRLKERIDNDYLYKLDEESHAEACASGGLLKYWFGKSDAERRNLATCFWHSREDAYRGGLGPWHKKARAAGRELYENITFSTHWFTVLDEVKGYKFEDY